ncbi:MAG: leucine-rich repeat domain-containing protein [Clostridia bacterium]|nr:leucine-rich repeat domain-containing protein [Clostridia bacterium]
MKKKILMFILSICLIIPAMFCLAACSLTDAPEIEFKVENGYIQYYDGESWSNLIAIEDLKGEEGDDGEDADVWTIGDDGYWYKNGVKTNKKAVGDVGQKGNGIKSITTSDDPLKTNATQTTYIITLDDNSTYEFVVKNGTNGSSGDQYTIGTDGYWYKNGVKTNDKAIGEDGDEYTIGEDGYWYLNGEKTEYKAIGVDATYATYTITYDYGRAIDFFETGKANDEIKSIEWLTTLPKIKDSYKNLFIGWCIEGSNKLIENYDFIGGDVTLYAKFVVNENSPSGLYQEGKYVKTWSDLKTIMPDAITNNSINANIDGQHRVSYFDEMTEEIVVDDSITEIGEGAFTFCDFKGIYLKDGVTTIGDAAFYGCKNLKDKFNLPTSIANVGQSAFGGLWDWQYNISHYGKYVGNLDNPYMILLEPTSSSFSEIHEDCYVIAKYAFKGSSGLTPTKVSLPYWISKISSNSFYYCNSITSLIVDSLILEEIEENAFEGCLNLQSIFLAKNREQLWQNATINDEIIKSATVYYYSEQEPTTEGNYWHYDTDGKTPIIW